jgi:cytosine permease
LIFAFMIIGFLALENALLYYGTLFMFGWAPSTAHAFLIYGVLTAFWVALTIFGLKVVQRTSTVLLVAFLGLTVVMAIVAIHRSGVSPGELFSQGPVVPGYHSQGDRLQAVISILAGSAGALALVDADFARYARTSKDVGILALGGAFMIDIVVVILGAITINAGSGIVAKYLHSHPATAATQVGGSIGEKVAWMVNNNTGSFFVVLAGLLGFLLMYVAQVKAQVLNTYSGSLALSNLCDGVFGWNPGRVAMVVVANVVGLAMVAGNILGQISSYLGILGVTTTALASVVIADYFIVRRRQVAAVDDLEEINWAGVISVVAAAVIGGILQHTGVTALGFLVALVIVLILYPPLRRVIKPSRRLDGVEASRALAEN